MPDRVEVAIAGCGAVTAVGVGLEPLRTAVRANASGLRTVERFDHPRFQSSIVGAVPEGPWHALRPRPGDDSPSPFPKGRGPGRGIRSVVNPTVSSVSEDHEGTESDDPAWNLATQALQQAREQARHTLATISQERIGLVLSTTKANIAALEYLSDGRPCSTPGRRHLQADLLAADL